MKTILFLLFVGLSIKGAHASCSSPDTTIFNEINSIRNWNELNSTRIVYIGCDDGAYAELFSEKVSNLFLNEYEEFISNKIYKDSVFYKFIKLHIDPTWDGDSLHKLKKKLKIKCKPKNICKELIIKTNEAIKNL